MKYLLTASIVTYNNDCELLTKAISTFLESSLSVHLYIVDHSPHDDIKLLCHDERISYLHTGQNLGFGKGHNIILREHDKIGEFHLVLNPDIVIQEGTLEYLVAYLQQNKNVGMVMPEILNPDDSLQLLPKLFPHPLNLLLRYFPFFPKWTARLDGRYMMTEISHALPFDVGIVSGCFMLMRSIITEKALFDERFFMYFEDFDLSRRVGRHWSLQMVPNVAVYHDYERGSHKGFFLFKTMVFSMIKYFNKYGWCFDNERTRRNNILYDK